MKGEMRGGLINCLQVGQATFCLRSVELNSCYCRRESFEEMELAKKFRSMAHPCKKSIFIRPIRISPVIFVILNPKKGENFLMKFRIPEKANNVFLNTDDNRLSFCRKPTNSENQPQVRNKL